MQVFMLTLENKNHKNHFIYIIDFNQNILYNANDVIKLEELCNEFY